MRTAVTAHGGIEGPEVAGHQQEQTDDRDAQSRRCRPFGTRRGDRQNERAGWGRFVEIPAKGTLNSIGPRSRHISMRPYNRADRRKWGDIGGAIMNIAKPLKSAEIEKSSEVEAGGNIHELARGSSAVFRPGEASDVEMSSDNLAGLLRRVSEASTREIENLVGDLQALRKKLHTDGNRIQRDITEYAELTQQVMQLTKIISESVKKLPTALSVNQ